MSPSSLIAPWGTLGIRFFPKQSWVSGMGSPRTAPSISTTSSIQTFGLESCNRMRGRVTSPPKLQSILCMEYGVQSIWRQGDTVGQRLLAVYGNIHSPFSHRVPGFSLAHGGPELKVRCPASLIVRGEHTFNSANKI